MQKITIKTRIKRVKSPKRRMFFLRIALEAARCSHFQGKKANQELRYSQVYSLFSFLYALLSF